MSVKNALLGLLAHHPRHGYELHDAFEAMVGGEQNWDLKPAQVYSTLTRLEKQGLIVEESIEQDGGPEKRIYTLTDAGHKALARWFSVPVGGNHQRDEFFLKLMISLAAEDGDPRQVIYVQRASLYKELHAITAAAQPGRSPPRAGPRAAARPGRHAPGSRPALVGDDRSPPGRDPPPAAAGTGRAPARPPAEGRLSLILWGLRRGCRRRSQDTIAGELP